MKTWIGVDEMAYTEAERHAIDAAYGKMGRNEALDPDELQLVISYEREQACNEALFNEKIKLLHTESEERRNEFKERAKTAHDTLKMKRNLAKKKLERSGYDEK